jgi:hypothetical protein
MSASDDGGESLMLITPTEILNRAIPGLPSMKLVVRLCKRKGSDFNHLIYSANGKNFFIKYNNASMNEARSQLFFHDQIAKKEDATIRIPQIYHAFETDDGRAYIIMEYIDIDPERPASDQQRVQAISELITIPPPPGRFGSIAGGRFWHNFFKDREPPVPFTSSEELEGYINRVGLLAPRYTS